MKKILIFMGLLIGLSNCSFPELGYRYADWLIKKRILKVVKFYSADQKKLEQELDAYMLWHQKTMLPRYVSLLEVSATDFSGKVLRKEQVTATLHQVRNLYYETILPLAVRVTPLLAGLNSRQVERSKVLLTRKIEGKKEKVNWPRERLVEWTQKKWRDNLQDWLGSVTTQQEELLSRHKEELIYPPKVGYAYAVKHVQDFISLLEENPLRDQRLALLKAYFEGRQEIDEHRQWRPKVAAFIAELFSLLTPEQKTHLLKKVRYWQNILGKLTAVKL